MHFLFQSLKEFPQVSIRSVSKTQRSSGVVSSYMLISRVISTTFSATEWHNLMADMGVSYFFCDAETAVSPHYSVSRDNWKIVSGSRKLLLAIPWPA
jgi:hypothetical protein